MPDDIDNLIRVLGLNSRFAAQFENLDLFPPVVDGRRQVTKNQAMGYDAPDPGEGVMVALETGDVSKGYSVKGPDHHITLAFLGKAKDMTPDQHQALDSVVSTWAKSVPPLAGKVTGFGTFADGDENVHVATVSVPYLEDHRTDLVRSLEAHGLPVSRAYGYTPHVTLHTGDDTRVVVPKVGKELSFPHVLVKAGGVRGTHKLSGIRKGAMTTEDTGGEGTAPQTVEQKRCGTCKPGKPCPRHRRKSGPAPAGNRPLLRG